MVPGRRGVDYHKVEQSAFGARQQLQSLEKLGAAQPSLGDHREQLGLKGCGAQTLKAGSPTELRLPWLLRSGCEQWARRSGEPTPPRSRLGSQP